MQSTDLLKALPSLRLAQAELQLGAEASASTQLAQGDQPVLYDIGQSLCCAYLVDASSHWRYVQQRDLSALGAQTRGLHEIALLNLGRLAAEQLRLMPLANSHGLLLDGQFEASLLLLDDLWDESLAAHAPNGFIAAVPTRDVLAFCDAQSKQGISELSDLAQRTYASGQHRVSPLLYQRTNGIWQVFELAKRSKLCRVCGLFKRNSKEFKRRRRYLPCSANF